MDFEKLKQELKLIVEGIVVKKIEYQESLVESGLLDSISMVDLTIAIEDQFKIKIDSFEVKAENFENLECLAKFIRSKI